MTAIKNSSGIAPGKILYYVCGTSIVRNSTHRPIEERIEKYICTSFPKYWVDDSRTDSLFFDHLIVSDKGSPFKSHSSLKDCGIGAHYNLNRLFGTREEALEFAGQCMLGKFFDIADQKQYTVTKERFDLFQF